MTDSLPPRPGLWPPKPVWPIEDRRGTRIRQPTAITSGDSHGNGLLEFHRYSGADDQVIGVELSGADLDRLIAGLNELRETLQTVTKWAEVDQA